MLGNRRIFFHGAVFFALAPFFGFLIMAPVSNPRAMLSLHLSAWLAGAVMVGVGAVWPYLALTEGTRTWVERGFLTGMWTGLFLAAFPALLGTSTMFAGGTGGPAWAEGAVKALQILITVTLVPALVVIAVGLGKPLPVSPAP